MVKHVKLRVIFSIMILAFLLLGNTLPVIHATDITNGDSKETQGSLVTDPSVIEALKNQQQSIEKAKEAKNTLQQEEKLNEEVPQPIEGAPGTPVTPQSILGSVKKGDKPIKGDWVNAHQLNGEDKWVNAQTDENGGFSLSLLDGTYEIQGIWVDSEQKWYPLSKTFEVVNGQLTDESALTIDLGPDVKSATVSGVVTKSGKGVSGDYVNARKANGEEAWYNGQLGEDGSFSLTLPDGSYEIQGIWVDSEQKWYPLSRTFEVADGKLTDELALTIELAPDVKSATVSGVVTKSGKGVSGDYVNARKTNGAEAWYNGQLGEDGSFSLTLPDGTYEIQGIWVDSEQKWYPLSKTFEVVDGKLMDESALTIELAPDVKTAAVSGSVTKNGKGVSGDYVNARKTNGAEAWYNGQLGEDGSFSLTLPDGTYEIQGIWVDSEQKWYPLAKTFEVVDGKLTDESALAIELAPNVKTAKINGAVTKKGQPIIGDYVNARKTSGAEAWYSGQLDEYGQFSLTLPDGTYEIEGVWVEREQKWYQLNQSFAVDNGKLSGIEHLNIELAPKNLPSNVKGTVKKGDESVGIQWINIHTTGENAKWYNAPVNELGQFELYLPDGSYEIDGVWIDSEQKWYDKSFSFAVENGKATDLLINLKESLPESTKVQGHIDISSPEKTVLSFKEVTKGSTGKWYDVSVDEQGQFSVLLPDGDYRVVEMYHPETGTVPLGTMITVKDKQFFVDGKVTTDLNIAIPPVTLTGVIKDNGVPIKGAKIGIIGSEDQDGIYISVSTNDEGSFSVRLPAGTYTINSISTGGSNVYPRQIVQVKAEGTIVNLDLNDFNKEISVKGQVTSNGQVINEGNITISTSNGRSRYTGEFINGEFSVSLAAGDYKVIAVESASVTAFTTIPFSVTNGMNKPLNINVPKANISGKVSSANSENIKSVTIEAFGEIYRGLNVPVNASGEFSLYMPDGDYRIANLEGANLIPYMKSFSITSGKIYENGVEKSLLEILVPKLVSTGSVKDNAQVVLNTRVQIESLNGRPESYNITSDEQGVLRFYLPDGQYAATNLTVDYAGSPIYQLFSVKDGQLYVNDKKMPTLDFDVPANKVTLQLDGINPGSLHFVSLDEVNGRLPGASVEMMGKSERTIRLANGSYRFIQMYVYDEQQVYLNTNIVVKDGNLTVNGQKATKVVIQKPKAAITGTISLDGKILTNAHIMLGNEGARNYFSVETDETGQIKFLAQDGRYEISYVSSTDGGNRFDINKILEVKQGNIYYDGKLLNGPLNIHIPAVSLKGKLLDGGTVIGGTYFYVQKGNEGKYIPIRTNGNGEFSVRLEDGDYTVRMIDNPDGGGIPVEISFKILNGKLYVNDTETASWNLSIPGNTLNGTVFDNNGLISDGNISVVDENKKFTGMSIENGHFNGRLADGKYQVHYIYDGLIGDNYDLSFEIKDGLLYVNNQQKDGLDIKLSPVVLIGTVSDSVSVVKDAYVNIKESTSDKWYDGKTDKNGNIYTRLNDGNYVISSVSSDGFFGFNKEIVVKDHKVEGELVGLKLPNIALTGSIFSKDGTKESGSITVSNEGTGFSTGTNEEHNFFLRLPDGNYTANSVYLWETSQQIEVNIKFSIVHGKLMMNNVAKERLDIQLP